MKGRTDVSGWQANTALRTAIVVELARRWMSQRTLAERLGVAPSTLSGWLIGVHRGPPDLVEKIARALGVKPEALTG